MNPEDYIPRIPPAEWGFKRFGRDLFFPSIATSYAQYRKYYEPFIKQFKMWTRMDFPAFHGSAKTDDFERTVYDISDSPKDMYDHLRFSIGGTITFAQYFRIFTEIAGAYGIEIANDAAQLAKYGDSVFSHFLSYFAHNQIAGHDTPGAHQEEGYLAKLMLCYEMDIDIEENGICDTRRFTVNGDASISVRNSENKLVGWIERGKIDERLYNDSDFISMYVDDLTGAMSVWIPVGRGDIPGAPYTIEIRSHHGDALDITWDELAPLGGMIRSEFYGSVKMPRDKWVKWSDVKPDEPTKVSGPADAFDIEVSVDGEPECVQDGECFELWMDTGDHIMPNVGDDVIADAIGARNVTYGRYVCVRAYHYHHIHFRGWQDEHGEIVSRDKSYVFCAEGPRKLIALFEKF